MVNPVSSYILSPLYLKNNCEDYIGKKSMWMSFEDSSSNIFSNISLFLTPRAACMLEKSWQSLSNHVWSSMRRIASKNKTTHAVQCADGTLLGGLWKSHGASAESPSSLLGPGTVVWATCCVQRSRLHLRLSPLLIPIRLDEVAGSLCDRKGPVAQDAIVRRFCRALKGLNY